MPGLGLRHARERHGSHEGARFGGDCATFGLDLRIEQAEAGCEVLVQRSQWVAGGLGRVGVVTAGVRGRGLRRPLATVRRRAEG